MEAPGPDGWDDAAGSGSIAEAWMNGRAMPAAPVDLGSARATLAAADHAPDRDGLRHANDALFDDLAAVAARRGRTPVPRSPAPRPPDDPWAGPFDGAVPF